MPQRGKHHACQLRRRVQTHENQGFAGGRRRVPGLQNRQEYAAGCRFDSWLNCDAKARSSREGAENCDYI
jgi:hypothetical protein